ncbi:MAG TPA: hypothetical protein VK610_04745, partial [Rhodothermales bacterium]|nr:hypothetical protein [Rhodothermales bacterium]
MLRPVRAVALLVLGCVSVVSARAQGPAAPLTAEDRTAAVGRIAELLDARYVFPEMGVTAGRHVQAQLAAGAYDGLADAG